jgi:hypothetical protein
MHRHRIHSGLALAALGIFAGVCNAQHAITAVEKGYLGVADCRVWLLAKGASAPAVVHAS